MRFATEITLAGPLRAPAQMLADQQVAGHVGVHDREMAASVGFGDAPIEGPTHFSQFDPLASVVWGPAWFERGCISSHFQTPVVEGEQVRATMGIHGYDEIARIEAAKEDGTPVLTGSASVGPSHPPSALDARRAAQRDPGELYIVDQLEVGMRGPTQRVAMNFDDGNGAAYPFSLSDKLARITEPHPWYSEEGSESSPWGRPVVPMEMISVLAFKKGEPWPVRSPALGLFLDLEVRLIGAPVFVGEEYTVEHEVVGLGQSRRTESYWTTSTLRQVGSEDPVAIVLLHSGVFKESYPEYPKDLLA